jgi:hypothetical protein
MTVSNPQYVVLGLFLVYVVVVGVLWKVNQVEYATIGDTIPNVQRGIVIPIGVGVALLAVATTVLGAWHDVLFEDSRHGPGWAIIVPVLWVLVTIVNISCIDWRSDNRSVLPWLAVGTLLVGFAEEVVTRGTLVVGLREAGWSELKVYLVCTVCFALLHGINAFFGQSMQQTLVQIGMAFLGGTALYVTRMTTGTLLTGIVMHAAWDFGLLGISATKGTQKVIGGLVAFAMFAVGLVAVWFVV